MTAHDFKRETSSEYQNHELIAQKPRAEFIAPNWVLYPQAKSFAIRMVNMALSRVRK